MTHRVCAVSRVRHRIGGSVFSHWFSCASGPAPTTVSGNEANRFVAGVATDQQVVPVLQSSRLPTNANWVSDLFQAKLTAVLVTILIALKPVKTRAVSPYGIN